VADDFQIVKERVIKELMIGDVDNNRIQEILSRLRPDGSFIDINYDDLSRTAGFPHRKHTRDLFYMAKAYQQKESTYYENTALKRSIDQSFKFWVEHDFVGDNWHNNQISTPTNLVNLMLIIGDQLPADLVARAQPIIGRAHMNASGARPSGDRIVIAAILAKNLLFVGDKEQFKEIMYLIEGEVKFSTGHRGMQHDYSFHHRHDRVNNTTSYGYGKYANAFGEWSYYVANTEYAFSVEKINHLVDYYLDGIYKQMVYGVYTDISVKNRSISHKATFEPHSTLEIERLLFGTDYRKEELQEIINLRKGISKPSSSFCKFFWQTEHLVFQRPDFYTTVRMFSTRNRNMEEPYNGPGKTTHHRADGTNYLMLKGNEYHNIWPVYDWQKISGTTILQKPNLPSPDEIQKDGLTDFVGGVTDGLYGAAAFDFRSPHDLIRAKKSWFFFDEEYVCLGSDIDSDKRLPVVTTINQSLMRSNVIILQDQQVERLPRGRHQLEKIKWVLQDHIGYIFPEPTQINLSNEISQGRWSDITDQKNISDSIVSEDVFLLYYDHGERPNSATYEYIVVPNVSEEELLETSANNRDIVILSNTPYLQAVEHTKLGICQITAYQSGSIRTSSGIDIASDSQGMAMVKYLGNRIEKLTVSDPSRKLSRMHVTVSGAYDSMGEHFDSTIDKDGNTCFHIDMPQGVLAGSSVVIALK